MTDFLILWFDSALKGLILCALVLAVLALKPRGITPTFRHRLCLATLGFLIVLPLCGLLRPSQVNSAVERGQPALIKVDRKQLASTAVSIYPNLITAERTVDSQPTDIAWPPLLLILWGAGSSVMLAYVAFCQLVSWRVASGSRPSTEPELINAFEERVGDSRVRLMLSEHGPACGGILKRTVYLPFEATSWQPETLDMVLVHELGHVKRQDPAASLVGHVACALHWFNPLAWVLLRRMREESERCCDDLVLASGVDAADYALELVDLARSNPRRIRAAALSQMAHISRIERRLGEIMMQRTSAPRGRMLSVALAVATVAVAIPLMGSRLVAATPVALAQDDAKKEPAVSSGKAWKWERHPAMKDRIRIVTDDQGNVLEIEGIHPKDIKVDNDGIAFNVKPAIAVLKIISPPYNGGGVNYRGLEIQDLDPTAAKIVIDKTGQMRQGTPATKGVGTDGMSINHSFEDQSDFDVIFSPKATRLRLILTEDGAYENFKKVLKEQQELAKNK